MCRQREDLKRLHLGDLFLATAALQNAPGALAAFRAQCTEAIHVALSRFPRDRGFRDEVMQLLLERLFVARPQTPPAITKYTGRGSLARWSLAVAVRIAIDRTRGRGRAHYRAAFTAAFQVAVVRLPAQSKRLLREHFVFGLSTARLAELLARVLGED